MARKIYRYSLQRKDAKVAGVCSTIGAMTGVDPTFIRIGFVAAALFASFPWTLLAYAATGIVLALRKSTSLTDGGERVNEFDTMDGLSRRKPTVHAMLHDLDTTDRRLMAIDHHVNRHNDELAREIEALRQEEK